MAGPEIASRGVVYVKENEALLDELRAAVAALGERDAGRPVRSRGRRRPRAHRRPPVHQPALPAQARRAAHHPGGLMPATVSADVDKPITVRARGRARPRAARAVRAITAGGCARRAASSRSSWPASRSSRWRSSIPRCPDRAGDRVGPVGAWLGWALFRAFGYAGFLLPAAAGRLGAVSVPAAAPAPAAGCRWPASPCWCSPPRA